MKRVSGFPIVGGENILDVRPLHFSVLGVSEDHALVPGGSRKDMVGGGGGEGAGEVTRGLLGQWQR